MGQVALAEKPLEIAVGGGADVVGFEGGFFLPVAGAVGLVALLAVVAIEEGPGLNRLRTAGERVGAGVVLRGDAIPMTGRGSEGEGGEEGEDPSCLRRKNKNAPKVGHPWPAVSRLRGRKKSRRRGTVVFTRHDPGHRTPPFEERNQLPIWGTSMARPAR